MTRPQGLTERQERLLLTLHHRGRPARWPSQKQLTGLTGLLCVDGEKLELTQLGTEYCTALLAGAQLPSLPAPASEAPTEPEIVVELERFHQVHGHWPTACELTAFRGCHHSRTNRMLRAGELAGLIEVSSRDGVKRGRRFRPLTSQEDAA